MLLIFVALAVCNGVIAQSQLDDACHLVASGAVVGVNPGDEDIPDFQLEIPSNCTSGDVNWPYPQGNMHLFIVRYDFAYTLCIEEYWFTSLAAVTETTGGLSNPLPLPTDGKPSCTHDLYGRAELTLTATEPLLYVTNFKYTINPIVP